MKWHRLTRIAQLGSGTSTFIIDPVSGDLKDVVTGTIAKVNNGSGEGASIFFFEPPAGTDSNLLPCTFSVDSDQLYCNCSGGFNQWGIDNGGVTSGAAPYVIIGTYGAFNGGSVSGYGTGPPTVTYVVS